jgi:hypothetical protein
MLWRATRQPPTCGGSSPTGSKRPRSPSPKAIAVPATSPGTKLLRPLVEDPSNPNDSQFEDAFRAFIVKYDLPEPQINIDRKAGRADAFFPDHN